jgi:hypothetical protein
VPAARPDGLAETVKVRGVVRLPEGETLSQVRSPLAPFALAEKVTVREALTVSDAWTEVVLPAVAESEIEVGERVKLLPPSSWPSAQCVHIRLATRIEKAKIARKTFIQILLADRVEGACLKSTRHGISLCIRTLQTCAVTRTSRAGR